MNLTDELFSLAETDFQNYVYNEADNKQSELIKRLSEKLSDENLEIFNEIIRCACTMECEYGQDMFTIGFSMGMKIAVKGLC